MPSAQGHITVRRRAQDGTDGSDAVRYWVIPSATQVKRAQDGTMYPNTVTCEKRKQSGDSAPVVTSEGILYYQIGYNDGSMTTRSAYGSSGIKVTSTMAWIKFMLDVSQVQVASETVSIVADGKGVSSVKEWYLRSTKNTGVKNTDSGWQLNTVPQLTDTYKYLWNYEEIVLTDGTTIKTPASLIGVYGRGIKSVTNYYLATTASSGVTTSTVGWTTGIQSPTPDKRYLWNYEIITYDDDSTTVTAPHIICVYGQKGDPGKDGNNGDDGEDAVRYWLVPSVTSISKSKTGVFQPSGVTCKVMRQIGSGTAGEVTTMFVRYKCTYTNNLAMSWKKLSNGATISVSGYARSVEIELYMNGSVGNEAVGTGVCLDRVSIPVVIDGNDGDDGEQGIQGCIYRRSRFATGFQYRNDSTIKTDGLRYIDLVYLMTNSSIFASKAKWFRCKKTHISNSSNAPQLTSDGTESWLEYWEPLNSLEPTYTPFLMADDAIITLMQSNQLLIENDEGVITAGLSGSNSGKNIRIWAGSSTPDNAPFRVDVNGALVATKANITGTIYATDGTIAGFKISGSMITNAGFDNDAAIIIRNDERNVVAAIGGNILPSSLGGLRAIARFQNNENADYWGDTNYGVIMSAKGASQDNIALAIEGGCVQGLALKTMFVGLDNITQATKPTYVSKTIGREVNSVLAVTEYKYRASATNSNGSPAGYSTETREVRLTLPTMEHYDDGHIIFIKRGNNNGNVIKVYPGTTYRLVANSSYTGFTNTFGRSVILNDNNTYNTPSDPMQIKSEGDAMILVYHRALQVTIGSTTYHGVWVQHKCPREW